MPKRTFCPNCGRLNYFGPYFDAIEAERAKYEAEKADSKRTRRFGTSG